MSSVHSASTAQTAPEAVTYTKSYMQYLLCRHKEQRSAGSRLLRSIFGSSETIYGPDVTEDIDYLSAHGQQVDDGHPNPTFTLQQPSRR